MRIGLIRMRYTPYGGAETFLERFINGLLEAGHEVEVYSSRWEERQGVRFHRVRSGGPAFLRPLLFAINVNKEIGKDRPDVVISLERTFGQDIYRAGDGCHREWLRRRGKTVSPLKRLSIWLNPRHRALLYLEKRLFSDPALKKVAANSKAVKRDIIGHYGLPEDKICVIYNGINRAWFNRDSALRESARQELGVGADSSLLLFVGSGFERKGLSYLIRAMGELKGQDVKLLAVGKGDIKRYKKEAVKAGAADRVIFTGPVKGAFKYFQAGDIFVLPTVYEPFSNACLEAMAAGLPVVTSRVNGASEILTEGVNGSVVEDPADHVELARKIRPFLDGAFRARAGEAARIEAEKHPIEKNVEEFLRLIEECRR